MLDVLLTVPHGAPGNDALAPYVAKALHDRLKAMRYDVRTLISRTCRYTDIDMNRGDGRGSQFRSSVREMIEKGPPRLHIDVHSFPPEIPRFGHQDIVLLHGFEHPDMNKPLQDGDWLRQYARLLSGTVSACVQPSEYPNDVCQHVISLGQPRDRTMLAEHHNSGDPGVFAAAHALAIAHVLSEISQVEPQQHSPGQVGTTGGGGLHTPTQFGEDWLPEKYDGRAGPRFKPLKKGKVKLDPEERALVMKRKAVWHHGPKGSPTPAVWKSVVNGTTWYVTNTHRCYNVTRTLKSCIKQYHDFVKGTAESVA